MIGANLQQVSTSQSTDSALWAQTGQALQNIQRQLDSYGKSLQSNIPLVEPLSITDQTGNLVVQIGTFIDPTNNTSYIGIWVAAGKLTIGGTGPATGSTPASFPSAVQGDILYYNGTAWVVLIPGTSGQVLQTQGASANPIWATLTPPTSLFAVQHDVTGSRVLGTVYHNTLSIPMAVSVTCTVGAGATMELISDSSPSPSTLVVGTTNTGSATGIIGMTIVVPAGNYYSATLVGGLGALAQWIETY